ncbi:MAG: hypothetical protein LBM98_12950 [Oscillospiraceae bacterium]|nr:hypothetical protein [Oscillospiraceae bacterium]
MNNYGGLDEGTGLGLLRAVRNDGGKDGATTREGGFETRPYVATQPSSKPSKAPLFRGGCLRRGGGCRNPRPNLRL